jgi:predicted SAM-dependent methyltransferase
MLARLLRSLVSRAQAPMTAGLRLHIGGIQAHPDWKIFNIQPGPGVDFVGACTNLSMFADGSIAEIYASHVLEHLGYVAELPLALSEMRRVLAPGASIRISVPDLDVLAALLCDPATLPQDRFKVMRMLFGGQVDDHDYHRVGLNFDFLASFLHQAGFEATEKVEEFGLFEDTSRQRFLGRPISLNVQARKPLA